VNADLDPFDDGGFCIGHCGMKCEFYRR
jgi:hypothetical protein